jgi:hypothetical protein
MLITYTFVKNCKEYEYEYEADDSEVFDLIKDDLAKDGYDIYEVDDSIIDEYIDMAMDDIKDYFCADAYEEWKDAKSYDDDPLGYYGFSIKDFI